MNIKYFCIHHSPASERKQYLAPFIESNNLNINWIEDFLPTDECVLKHQRIFCNHSANGNYLNKSEISCFMKHRLAINNFLKSGEDHALIFEDDIEIPNFDFLNLISKTCDHFKKNKGDILFIGSMTGMDIRLSEFGSIFCSKDLTSRCAHCYLLSRDSAQKIYPLLEKIIAPFDWQLNFIIKQNNLLSCWSSPHINQRTEKGLIKSLLR